MKQPYLAVCGGINVDICGRAFAALIPKDSNPGSVRLSLGGVGRNVAHNLRLLGFRVTLLTALGSDLFASRVLQACAEMDIDLSCARRVLNGRTGIYLALLGSDGEPALAVCDTELIARIDPPYLAAQLPVLDAAEAVVLDANLSAESIRFLAEHCSAPLFADPVSVSKAEKLRPVLGRLHTLKPNRLEAELLSGVPITDRASMELAAKKLLDTGLRRVFLSLSAGGAFCAERGRSLWLPAPPTAPVNATGGGDAMMAGIVAAYCEGLPLEKAAALALACGSIAVESGHTVNSALSMEAARRRAEANKNPKE